MIVALEVDLPADLAQFRLPDAVAARLQGLLDRQDAGQALTTQERAEAEGLVGLRVPETDPYFDRCEVVSLVHIVRLEPIPVAPQQQTA
jgi:hypothetical protein